MKELSIANFKYGLDSRREALTSLLGTLVTCQDAHINPGGEVEKRKAFVDLGLINTSGVGVGNIDFFMVNDIGYVFYSAPTDVVVNPAYPFESIEMPLEHPAVTAGAAYAADYHAFVKLGFATVFNGYPFVSAVFADGNTFLYYNGALVNQSANGRVFYGRNDLASLATDLTTQIDAVTDWNALANVDQNGAAQDGTVIVKSPQGVYYTPVPSQGSDDGFLGVNIVDKDNTGTVEVKATASFLLTRSSDGTVQLQAPAESDGTGTAELTGGAVSTAASDVLMAAKVVQAVNDLTPVHGYTAANNGATISVYAPIGWGASINGFNLTVTVTGGMGTGGAGPTPTNLSGTISPSPLIVTSKSLYTGRILVGGNATISVSGGTGPYIYLWSDFGDLTHSDAGQATISLRANLFPGEAIDQIVKCTVTDTVAASIEVFLSVHLERIALGDD